MKKKLMMLAAMTAALPLVADTWVDPDTDIEWTYTVSNGKAILGGQAVQVTTQGAITIPSTLGGYPVTSIGAFAFSGCSGLASVTIPDSVTSIGVSAFNGCSSLTTVTIPDGVTSIGASAFSGCSGLTSVTIPDSVTRIGGSAFNGCGNSIFDISTIRGVKIVDGWIVQRTISQPSGHLDLSGVRGIVDSAFLNCTNLTGVTIGDSVIGIGSSAFRNCSGLTSLTISDGVKNIGGQSFYGCSGLTSVAIPNSVTSIGSQSFYGCSGLTSVTIGYGVTVIAIGVFSGCSNLVSVAIGNGVQAIFQNAFASAEASLVFAGRPPPSISSNALQNCYVSYPAHYEPQWRSYLKNHKELGCVEGVSPKILSSKIRESDPGVMDVSYLVRRSGVAGSIVKVRALAFEDGERSFARVVRPETFIDGTDANIGDSVEANVEHTISWKVSDDWAARLAKVKLEVLVCEGDLLPLELRTIPASEAYGKMEVSRNNITSNQVFDALMWLYADKDPGLTLSEGSLSSDSAQLASGAESINPNAIRYVFSKMGYSTLSGAVLDYVNEETRLGLSPSGVKQYAYRIVTE